MARFSAENYKRCSLSLFSPMTLLFIVFIRRASSKEAFFMPGVRRIKEIDQRILGDENNVWKDYILPEYTLNVHGVPDFGARSAVYQRYDKRKPNVQADTLSRVLIFGGMFERGTWIYIPVNNIWFPLQQKTQPLARMFHTLTSFCKTFVLLSGGVPNKAFNSMGLISNSFFVPYEQLDESWLFDGINESWKKLPLSKGSKKPKVGAPHIAVALENRQSSCSCKESVFLYGGTPPDNGGALDDLWELTCDSEEHHDLSFKWSIVEREPHGHWPVLLGPRNAAQVDVAKTAMMLWPTLGEPGSGSQDLYWIFNSTSRTWYRFAVENDVRRKGNEIYGTAVFHEGIGHVLQFVDGQAYIFSISQRKWLNISSTLDDSGADTGFVVTAAYVDSVLLVFAFVPLEESVGRQRVWMLQPTGFQHFLWRLNRYKPRPPTSQLYGTWSNVGDYIILIPRQAPNLENLFSGVWSAVRAIVHGADVSWIDEYHPSHVRESSRFPLTPSVQQKIKMFLSQFFQTKHVIQKTLVVWQLHLPTLSWFPYSTSHSTSEASHFYSIGTNWGEKAVVTFGSSCTDDNIAETIPILCSDVWVYFVDSRRWMNVTILSAVNPGFRLLPSVTHYGESSFLLFGGAAMNLTQNKLDKFPYYRSLKSEEFPFPRNNFTAALDLISPMNDLWLLTLTDCNSTSCFDHGIVGVWKELRPNNKACRSFPPNKVGHSSQFIDGKLFVFGGISVESAGGKRHLMYRNEIWYYDFDLTCWFTAIGNGLEKFVTSPLVLSRRGMFHTCAIGKRVITFIPFFELEQENSVVPSVCFSYFTDTGQWIDLGVDYRRKQEESLFCWRDRIVTTTRAAFRYPIDHSVVRQYTNVYVAGFRPGCPAGQHSSNWSEQLCTECAKGSFPSTGATQCTPCPGGLSTEGPGATSISNCSCDPSYCTHGLCLVVIIGTQFAAECKCDFGYMGQRCEFPTLLIGLFSSIAVLLVIVSLTVFLRKLLNYRKVKRTKEFELEEMDRVWTISSSEIALLQTVDTSPSGSYGDVYKARYRDIIVAVKKLKVIMRNAGVEREFRREIQLMKSIRHPNIVLFIGAGMDEDSGSPFLVLEFMQGGSLTSVLRNLHISISSEQQIRFCLDAAKGLQFLHNLSPPRVHRDIKSSNLLLSERWVAKVADFGCARLVKREGLEQRVAPRKTQTAFANFSSEATTPLLQADRDLSRNVGAVLWRAPEIFSGESYGTKVDVYSFGILMWEIKARELPYSNKNYEFIEDVRQAVVSGERPAVGQDMPED